MLGWEFVLARLTIFYPYNYNVACSVCLNPVAVYSLLYILLAAKGSVCRVFSSYPDPGGQGLAEP